MARILLAKARFLTFDLIGMTPPLGVMYLASVLREDGHTVKIYESGDRWHDLLRFRRTLEEFRPDLLGISAITFEAHVMEAMAEEARDALPELPIVVGGPHPTGFPEMCARLPAVDYVVVGEGEQTMLELVEAVHSNGANPRAVAGVASVDDSDAYWPAAPHELIDDLDSIPYPAWDLIDLPFYARHISMSTVGRRPYMAMFTSRGCPYGCIYCHNVHGKRFRSRSPENVVGEIETLRRRYGLTEIEIVDDTFNLDAARMIEILERLAAFPRRPTLHFPNAVRTDLLDEKQIKLLRRAGTFYLSVAVETVSPRLQKLIRKRLDVERVRENIDLAVRAGLYVNGYFMLGFPTETYEEARTTIDWAIGTRLHQAFFFLVTPFEGTELFEMSKELLARRNGPNRPSDFDYFKGSCNVSTMSDEQLYGIQREAYCRFYLSPTRVLRIVCRYPRKMGLFRYCVGAGAKMLPRRRGNARAAESSFISGR